MGTQVQIRERIAKRITDSLKEGIIPWRSPGYRGVPTNPLTHQKFSGINALILEAVAEKKNYRSKYWGTYIQWGKLNLQVPKRPPKADEWGISVVRYAPYHKTREREGFISLERFNLIEPYAVFCAEQTFGKNIGKYLVTKYTPSQEYDLTKKVIAATGASIRHHHAFKCPHYKRPPKDRICLPPRKRFFGDRQYYASTLHELVHWSLWRIGWTGDLDQEELIAEIATGFLESELGLEHCDDLTNHNLWLDKWLQRIEDQPKYLFDSAAQAEKAVDYILGFSEEQKREEGLQFSEVVVESRNT
jgi:antirestriction protein ArdC